MALNAETTERNKSRYRGLVPFPKGKSGNPGGRTKQFAQCQRLCREASPDAARRLIELMQSEDERVALMAADKVLERAWGRPKEYDPNAEAPKKPPPFDPSLYTTEELRPHTLRPSEMHCGLRAKKRNDPVIECPNRLGRVSGFTQATRGDPPSATRQLGPR